jgi:hypothetical protein
MKQKRKMWSITLLGILIVGTLGVLNTGAAETTLRSPSIQRSEYYKYVFTVDYAGKSPLYLIFDGEKKEMHPAEEGSNIYISSMPFSSGEHQYAFVCDSAQLPNEDVYKIDEIDNYWILLNTLTRHFSWHRQEEKQLKAKFEKDSVDTNFLEELYNLQMDRIRVSAMVQGTLCRIQNLSPPQNFDEEELLKQLTNAISEYSLFSNVSKRHSDLREYFQKIGEKYIEDATITYSKLASAKKAYKYPKQEFQTLKTAIDELRSAKNTMQWTAVVDASEQILNSAEQLACIDKQFLSALNLGIRHLYVGIAAFYGDEEFGKQCLKENMETKFDVNISEEKLKIDLPQKENTSGRSVCRPSPKISETEKSKENVITATSYSYTGYTTRSAQKQVYGNTYRVEIDVHWGKLKYQPLIDYAVEVVGDASEITWMDVGFNSVGCVSGEYFTSPKYTSWMSHEWTFRNPPDGDPATCKQTECWLYHSCIYGYADFRGWAVTVATGRFLAGYQYWWQDGYCNPVQPR